jgi:hypothetical protein
MSRIEYETFEIVITPKGDGKTYAVAAQGPRHERNPEPVEFRVDDIVLGQDRQNDSNGTRHVIIGSGNTRKDYPILWTKPPATAVAREFGGKLFKAVFKDGVRDLFARCRTIAEAERKGGLRIRFDLSTSPQLAVWPWEYLHNPDRDQFFAMFPDTPVVRYLPLPYSEGPLEVEAPLRILVMVSLPKDVAKLDAAGELSGIKNEVEALSDQNLLAIEVLEEASLSALYSKLDEARRQGTPFHIFHYIGHGVFDTNENQGKLLLVGEDGDGEAVDGQAIGSYLHCFKDHLRLAIINSCEGARVSRIDSYAGVAPKILQSGEIPAALAMQFRITDRAAVTFAKLLYQGLADNRSLEDSLAKARLLMFGVNKEEWATPVLYMRASDGYILQVQPAQKTKSTVMTPGGGARLTNLTRHYDEIKKELDKGKLVIFLGLNVNLYGRQLSSEWSPGGVLPGNIELSDYLRKEHQCPLGAPLASLAQHLVVNRKKSDLYDAFANTFNDKVALPLLYPFLGQVAKRAQQQLKSHPDPVRRRLIILTTNYDKSLERGFDHNGIETYDVISYSLKNEQEGEFQQLQVERAQRISGVINEEQNKEAVLVDSNPVIIKLPGAVESGQPNYVVTEDHFFYLARRDLLKMLPKKIVSALTTSRHLYLGYNVQDWPFRALLYSIWGDRKPKYDSWAVIPSADDPNKPFWNDCDVEVIEAPLEDYVAGLQQYLFGSKGGGGEV